MAYPCARARRHLGSRSPSVQPPTGSGAQLSGGPHRAAPPPQQTQQQNACCRRLEPKSSEEAELEDQQGSDVFEQIHARSFSGGMHVARSGPDVGAELSL